jgi:hypothetical protein
VRKERTGQSEKIVSQSHRNVILHTARRNMWEVEEMLPEKEYVYAQTSQKGRLIRWADGSKESPRGRKQGAFQPRHLKYSYLPIHGLLGQSKAKLLTVMHTIIHNCTAIQRLPACMNLGIVCPRENEILQPT